MHLPDFVPPAQAFFDPAASLRRCERIACPKSPAGSLAERERALASDVQRAASEEPTAQAAALHRAEEEMAAAEDAPYHDGRISVHPNQPRGSRFEIEIPA